ncbi:hypothetical protein PAXRUDRAFT_171762, partial [Paxillus rubicundulus Ve08.2h10]
SPSSIGHPSSYEPSSTGLPHKPWHQFLGPPVAHAPFSIGQPIPFCTNRGTMKLLYGITEV